MVDSLHVAASVGSNKTIATKLGIPLATITKRRKFLEKHFLELFYTMNLGSLGHRRVDFLLGTQKGLTIPIANRLMKMKEVVSVRRSIGVPPIDLRAEIIVKNNVQLLELLGQVRAMEGIGDVIWSEIVKVVGDKGSVPADIIDIL